MAATRTMVHKFETAGLGAAPYQFLGHATKTYQACPGAPIQPGACCDYCGTGIMDTFRFRSADGQEFVVGSTCYLKAHGGKRNLRETDPVKLELRRIQGEKRRAREEARIAAGRELLAREDIRAALAADPHPLKWRAEQGDTGLDWAEWTMSNAGNRGRLDVTRYLSELAKKVA